MPNFRIAGHLSAETAPPIDAGTSVRTSSPAPSCFGSGLNLGLKFRIDVVPEHNPPDMNYNGFYWAERHLFPNAYLITDLQDMVNQILAITSGGCARIERLTISGHGNDTGFWVGDDYIDMDSLADDSISKQFSRLQYSFTPDGLVVIHACDVGKAETLLQKLSGLMGGVRVRAGTAKQFPARKLFGDVRTCTLRSCSTK